MCAKLKEWHRLMMFFSYTLIYDVLCISGKEKQHISSSEKDETDHRTVNPVSVSGTTSVQWKNDSIIGQPSKKYSKRQRRKNHQCRICDKHFETPSHLKIHIRVHSGQKPFKCKVCDQCFSQSGSLTQRMRIHSGQKPYKCYVCDQCFSQSGSLT